MSWFVVILKLELPYIQRHAPKGKLCPEFVIQLYSSHGVLLRF